MVSGIIEYVYTYSSGFSHDGLGVNDNLYQSYHLHLQI